MTKRNKWFSVVCAYSCASALSLVGAQAQEPLPTAASDSCTGRVRMRGINFAPDSSAIRDHDSPILNEVIKILQSCPSRLVRIEGHTDAQGTDEHNLRLSQQRADVVKRYLVRHGIAAERLTTVGYGRERPIANDDSEDGRTLNRRVTLTFDEK